MTIAAIESDLLRDVDDLADVMNDLTEAHLHCAAAIVQQAARMEKVSGPAATLAMLDEVEAALIGRPAQIH